MPVAAACYSQTKLEIFHRQTLFELEKRNEKSFRRTNGGTGTGLP
jgi:hypothetical protein